MVRDYRDLRVWQRGMDLLVVCHALSKRLPPEDRFTLGDQLRRAATSIPANIAEGNGRASRRDYIRFLTFANGSLRELETLLEALKRMAATDEADVMTAMTFATETRAMLVRLRAALK